MILNYRDTTHLKYKLSFFSGHSEEPPLHFKHTHVDRSNLKRTISKSEKGKIILCSQVIRKQHVLMFWKAFNLQDHTLLIEFLSSVFNSLTFILISTWTTKYIITVTDKLMSYILATIVYTSIHVLRSHDYHVIITHRPALAKLSRQALTYC